MKTEDKIKELLETIRPFLINDGGDIEFIDYKDGIVKVKLTGACSGCHMAQYTLKNYVESLIKEEIEEVKEVINVS